MLNHECGPVYFIRLRSKTGIVSNAPFINADPFKPDEKQANGRFMDESIGLILACKANGADLDEGRKGTSRKNLGMSRKPIINLNPHMMHSKKKGPSKGRIRSPRKPLVFWFAITGEPETLDTVAYPNRCKLCKHSTRPHPSGQAQKRP